MEHERADVELARVPPVAFLGSLSNRVAPRLRARHEEDDGRQIVFEVPVVEGRLEQLLAGVLVEEFGVARHLRQRGRLVTVVSDRG